MNIITKMLNKKLGTQPQAHCLGRKNKGIKMKKERLLELLRSAVNHIENFEDSESECVLESLGFTKDELNEIRQKNSKKENSKKIEAVDDYICANVTVSIDPWTIVPTEVGFKTNP